MGRRGRVASALLASLALCAGAGVAIAAGAGTAAASPAYRVERMCATAKPGSASCMIDRLVGESPPSLPGGQAAPRAAGAGPGVEEETPWPGFLTPQRLHAAYSLPQETGSSWTQTIAVVDAFNDPTAEADLGVYDEQFGLPPCTTENGCFTKLNQEGQASPLPHDEGGWATEISIDVQMAHAICQNCHILLIEAKSEQFKDLGAGVNAAIEAGATEVSNSYGGTEEGADRALNTSFYDHPGVVVTASSGDCGYLNEKCKFDPVGANFPANSPDVVAVGGTSLTEAAGVWSSTAWDEGGSGCSSLFSAPLWQTAAEGFSVTGCGSGRSIADVAAIGDPQTGVDMYDSTPDGEGDPTGWGVWGGTSVASPIVAAEFALAGGAHGVEYPAATLYTHLGDPSALYDVLAGSTGSCGKATSCRAVAGFDGPTGVGSPVGLGAFTTSEAPVDTAPPSISGTAQQGLQLTESHGEWTNEPTSFTYKWERCESSGDGCSPIAKATEQTYTPVPADVGSTIRVQERASNASGPSAPAVSAPTAVVVSDVPKIASVSPGSGITGSAVTITGSALTGASQVTLGKLTAAFTVLSPTEIQATVPDGAVAGKLTVTTSFGSANSAKFDVTLSVTGFSPETGPVGKVVTIKGRGFKKSSTVQFEGTPASTVTFVSDKKLKATVPVGATTGTVTVTNASSPAGTVAGASVFTVS